MNTLTNVDYTSYSDDELEQAIKDIQKVKANRKESRSNKQKIFIKSLSNQENESLSKDQNMLKTYIIGYSSGKPTNGYGTTGGDAYTAQNNSNDKCSLGYNFKTLDPIHSFDKKSVLNVFPGFYQANISSLISFSYAEI